MSTFRRPALLSSHSPLSAPKTQIDLAVAHALASRSNVVDVLDDASAIEAWLNSKAHNLHTLRSYRREAGRLLAFLNQVKGPGVHLLPAMTIQDVVAFVGWLQHPYNLDAEVLVRCRLKRQPVASGLGPASLSQSLTILSSMYAAMREMRGPAGPYCVVDPFHLAKAPVAKAARSLRVEGHELGKALPLPVWREVLATVDSLPRSSPRQERLYWQTWWLVRLYYFTLCREFEVLGASMSDVKPRSAGYSLRVHGKGGKRADIDVLAPLMESLRTYRTAMHLPPVPMAMETLPLVLHHSPPRGDMTKTISCTTVYRRITEIFRATADRLEDQGFDEHSVMKLREANVHWIRHTGISHLLDMGASQRYVQKQARHASLDTTSLYDHTDSDLRTADLNAAARRIQQSLS